MSKKHKNICTTINSTANKKLLEKYGWGKYKPRI